MVLIISLHPMCHYTNKYICLRFIWIPFELHTCVFSSNCNWKSCMKNKKALLLWMFPHHGFYHVNLFSPLSYLIDLILLILCFSLEFR